MADSHKLRRYHGGRLRSIKVPYVSFNDFEAYVLLNFTNPHRKSQRRRTKRQQAERDLTIATLGLAGEAGEVVDHFKKIIRDYDGIPADYPPAKLRKLLLEFGDVFHYFVYLAHRVGFPLTRIMAENIRKLNRRYTNDERRAQKVSAKRVRSADKARKGRLRETR